MKRNLKMFIALQIALALISFIIIVSSFGYSMHQEKLPKPLYIRDVKVSVGTNAPKSVTLPYNFKNLEPRTPVTVTARITVNNNDMFSVKTAYAPAKVYTDGMLIYELGKRETYPNFMLDPATEIFLIKPSVYNREAEFRMEFLSPATRSSMTVYPPMMAPFKSIFKEFVATYKIPFIFSIVQLAAGVFLAIVSLMMLFFEKKVSEIFFWLGMFSFVSGLWGFGECNLTALIIKNPTLLYLFAFIGLFTVCIPLIQLANVSIGFKNPKPLSLLSSFLTASAIIALILQFLGIYPLSSSMYAFHFMTICSLCILSLLTVYEAVKSDNLQAKRFVIPIVILTFASLIEVANYYFKFTYQFSSFFQDGVIIFILMMSFTIGFYIKDFAILRKQNESLAFEIGLMEIQIDEQRKYNELIARNEDVLKKQRHDLHHHLIAIRELAENGNEKLNDYLDTLSKNIPTAHISYCENKAVSAILSHYVGICKGEQIEFHAKLIVPEMSETSLNSDLAIIFGNLLENAIEACLKIDQEKRLIRISSDMSYDMLIVTMDNSYDGNFLSVDSRFCSTKREGFGIGLSSVQSVARKYYGDAKFEDKDGYFQSSVYLRIGSV